jgi:SAM-dependent methyltransferase
MTDFKDNFSQQSDIYVKYRPHYPKELYRYLSSLTPQHQLAWDCGTGNGQAAIGLTSFYDTIIATDPSEQQIKNAFLNEKIIYKVEKVEAHSLASDSVDLVTVANALHWFDFDIFYKQTIRVLKHNGIIAAWCYRIPTISPQIDSIVTDFNDNVMDNYWLPENKLVDQEYKTIPFPFSAIDSPTFFSERQMTLEDFIWYLNTWSATQRYISQHGSNPTTQVKDKLQKVWEIGDNKKTVIWRLVLKVGRVLKN